VLQVALELALDVLELDCGSVVLVPEETEEVSELSGPTEENLSLIASKGLSRDWLDDPRPLSMDRIFDRMSIGGELVVSEDLSSDSRVLEPQRLIVEGLGAAIHAGLAFQGRPIGVMRLYARLPRTFDESDRRVLRAIAAQAAVAVQQARLLKMQEEDQRLQRQLALASDVQRRMLPRFVPSMTKEWSHLDVAAKYEPSFELGGDFYDFINLSSHLGIVVGDVVGKGIAAALLMSAVRASLRAHAQGVYDLDEVISRVNIALCRDTLDNEFATLWYGVLDPVKLRLTYCSAGHEPPIVVRVPEHRAPGPADIDELSVGGMVVGIDRSQRYQRAVYDMHAGDVLVAYTDGVVDTVNFGREKFGKKRLRACLLEILKQEPKASANRIAEHIRWSLRQFAGLAQRPDDETIVVVRPWAKA
jgi:serine phosphatase RsbU (regulator of sigma subunit)